MFQFECRLTQKDVIGEWVPNRDPGVSAITDAKYGKWMRGIRWSDIDENFVLRHVTSAQQKEIQIDLRQHGGVMEELRRKADCKPHEPLSRAKLPTSVFPVIAFEETGGPYHGHQFRRVWRTIADAAQVPKNVENRNSRMAPGKRSAWQREREKELLQ